ncbi:protein MIZU-KUSSEI 1-like [Juglans microcarpa x Juglans regia]|uniref:protein MIZU-KUSSEI 1-like n=1 Tax=Juglans microcarpa x Juglans regia TaxID=2249226 RepID=UPI001B7EAF93|nr:protein MIZU-KUSSEI 1-like [Juglans microcarpa x Juglans regia]
MAYPRIGVTGAIPNGVTTVDCQKQVRSWRFLRSLLELLIPTCNCTTFVEDQEHIKQEEEDYFHRRPIRSYQTTAPPTSISTSSTTIIGTIFGYRRGKVRLCIQTSTSNSRICIQTSTSNSIINPVVLLLELAVPTTTLAREMRGGILRIALECATPPGYSTAGGGVSCSLLSMPLWTMYCNGRKVGYAVKRQPSEADMEALRLMSEVVAGAGIISGKELNREDDDELLYLRANFGRVFGSANSESFHLIDPDGSNIGQELSIFLFR